MKAVRRRPGVTTTIEYDGVRLNTRTDTAIPHALLQRNHERGAETGRAPLGDSHGAWQKVAELPLALVLSKIPPDQLEDEAAWKKLLNDPDFRAFRTDGGRKY